MTNILIQLILFCLGTAALSQFLQLCYGKGMIFRKYHNLIAYWFYLHKKVRTCTQKYIGDLYLGCEIKTVIVRNKYQWLYKLLGGCVYCQGTWIFIVFYLLMIYPFSGFIPAFVGLSLGCGINYFWLEVIEKIK
jgi:hypothetical protein